MWSSLPLVKWTFFLVRLGVIAFFCNYRDRKKAMETAALDACEGVLNLIGFKSKLLYFYLKKNKNN